MPALPTIALTPLPSVVNTGTTNQANTTLAVTADGKNLIYNGDANSLIFSVYDWTTQTLGGNFIANNNAFKRYSNWARYFNWQSTLARSNVSDGLAAHPIYGTPRDFIALKNNSSDIQPLTGYALTATALNYLGFLDPVGRYINGVPYGSEYTIGAEPPRDIGSSMTSARVNLVLRPNVPTLQNGTWTAYEVSGSDLYRRFSPPNATIFSAMNLPVRTAPRQLVTARNVLPYGLQTQYVTAADAFLYNNWAGVNLSTVGFYNWQTLDPIPGAMARDQNEVGRTIEATNLNLGPPFSLRPTSGPAAPIQYIPTRLDDGRYAAGVTWDNRFSSPLVPNTNFLNAPGVAFYNDAGAVDRYTIAPPESPSVTNPFFYNPISFPPQNPRLLWVAPNGAIYAVFIASDNRAWLTASGFAFTTLGSLNNFARFINFKPGAVLGASETKIFGTRR